MSVKTKIKNDLWRWNYILPFVKKHQFDEKGKIDVIRHIINAYSDIHPVKSKEGTVGHDTKALLSSVEVSVDEKSEFIYFIDTAKTLAVPGNILSNFTFDYNRVIAFAFDETAYVASGEDTYGKEAQAVIDGIRILQQRVCDFLKSANMDATRKEKLIVCFERMLSTKAEHFEEALQRILFFNQILWQTRHRLNGLGRLDKILHNLYEADKASGLIDYSYASELVLDFLSQLSRYPKYKSDALEGDIGQIIILGGKEADGSYFCNELTEIFLKQQAKLGKPDPKTLLRVGKGMPESILKTSVGCLLSKTGSPLYSNDEVVIPALIESGMPIEDAFSYCTSACWEPFIVGKSLDQNNVAVFDYFEALDKVLEFDFENFEELIDKYLSVNAKNFEDFLHTIDQMKWAKDPLVSMFTDSCNKFRIDISDGAATYNNYGITTVAISNVVDSLLNIKEIVFDKHICSLVQLNKARTQDFTDSSDLYDKIRTLPKHYGHDNLETIKLVNRITNSVSAVAKTYRNSMGGTVKFGLSSPGYNILSKKMRGDVSGRKYGMPYNTHISCTDAAYTEIVTFASKLEYGGQRYNGNVIDFFATQNLVENNIDKFVLFIRGSINSGFFQMQMNLLDSNTLIDAKKYPEKYKNLIVRVWGFSAYFNELPESYKNLLIERALAAEKIAI